MQNIGFVLFLLMVPSAVIGVAAQEQQNAPKPATKLESFQAKTGMVIVRGFTTVGALRGIGGGIKVDAREFRDASNPSTRVSGISISVKENDRLERENTSFIDSDEIDSLLVGLDYISKATKDITKLDQFEAEYRTKGDFSVTVFNESNGKLSVAISSGHIGKTTAYIKLADLLELSHLITSAKSRL
jgi:hypothetical protein